jgi:hypothetical protein
VITPEESLAEIRKLGLPPVFERIWAEEFPLGFFDTCQRPRTFFDIVAALEERLPRFKTCVPLWEENGERILAYDKAGGEYVSYYYEDLDCTVVGRTYQQFISVFLIRLVYSGVLEELPQLAVVLGYRHLNELQRWAETDDEDSCEESERKFLAIIRD